jgi:AmiR/NasT family two-component response regulator
VRRVVANTSFDGGAPRPNTGAMREPRSFDRPRALRFRVAVLERDATSRARLVATVEAAGVEVGVAATPRPEFVPLIRQTDYDVVFLGLDAPEANTLALATAIPCPLVLCSLDTSPEMIGYARQMDAMAFLVRPIRAEQIAPTIALAVARFRDRQVLRRALDERKLIERAKGRLMALQGVTEDDAFRWLRRRSMDTRTRMADVARHVLGQPVAFRTAPAGPPVKGHHNRTAIRTSG